VFVDLCHNNWASDFVSSHVSSNGLLTWLHVVRDTRSRRAISRRMCTSLGVDYTPHKSSNSMRKGYEVLE
jgi:transposase InsO family protein